jgi:uncharacterized protein CbrC (UPF0167 family)
MGIRACNNLPVYIKQLYNNCKSFELADVYNNILILNMTQRYYLPVMTGQRYSTVFRSLHCSVHKYYCDVFDRRPPLLGNRS